LKRVNESGVILALCCALAAACEGPPDDHERRTLVIALDSEPHSIDPRFGSDANADRLADLIHLGLTRAAPGGERAPALATRWDRPDPRTLVFQLRDDVRFASGAPVTAGDVRATYEAILDPATVSPKRAALAALAAVEAPDPHTVVMRLREPFPPFLDATGIGILPAARARERGEVDDGAGPFRVVERVRGERLVLAPNPGSPADARLARVVVRIVPDQTVRLLELWRGDVDFVQDALEPELLAWLEQNPALRVRTLPGTSFAYLAFNLRDPRLADRRVRRAIALALDRATLVRFVLGDAGRPATGLLAPEHWAYVRLPQIPYAPARARRLLDRAGYPDPDGDAPRFRIVYKTSTLPSRRRLAQAIQAELARVGIALDLRTYEWGTLYADVRTGNFEMAALTWVGVTEPDLYFLTLHSSMRPPSGFNRGRYANATMDALVDGARHAPDVGGRRRRYRDVQRLAARDLPVVPLWWEDRIVVHTRRLRGFTPTPSGALDGLASAWLEP